MAVTSRDAYLDGSIGMTNRPNFATPTTAAALACLLALAAGPAGAQSTTSSNGSASRDAGTLSHDCTEVTVDYTDDANLTREERIARMDRAFQRSLSRFEECQSERAGGGASGGGTGSGASGGGVSGSGTAGSESDGSETSTAASDISGPDAPLDAPAPSGTSSAASDVTGDEPTVTAATTPGTNAPSSGGKWAPSENAESSPSPEDGAADEEPVREAARTQNNGKVPEDIPPADNDSALEAQIRQAAIEETDPELKNRLWDEYRRYKGLPVAN
ncbi:MAG: hypothetical protein ACPGQM_00135 [Alphaproteobacteria bacterium]